MSIDTTAPTPIDDDAWVLNTPASGQAGFKAGDTISLTLTVKEALVLGDTTNSKVVIAGKDFVLDKSASSTAGSDKLVFTYTVQAGDNISIADLDIDNPSTDITLNNIGDSAGNAVVFGTSTVELGFQSVIQQTGNANPLNGIDIGSYSAPSWADIDGDGTVDLIVGESDGTLNYYKNTGTTGNPAYTLQSGNDNPFAGVSFDVGDISAPSWADIDGDGNLDLIVGEFDGTLNYYKNTGTTGNPAYTEQTGNANPFTDASFDVGNFSAPSWVDIDGDGKLDLIVGANDGTLHYYKNTGTTGSPAYSKQTGNDNPFAGVSFDVGDISAPSWADIDGDGTVDLIVGANDGTLNYYKNTGTTGSPAYSKQTGNDNPFADAIFDVGGDSAPSWADIDGDGDLDLIVGANDGRLNYYINNSVYVDTTAPTLSINTVATDDIINLAEKTAGVTVNGTATGADGQTITVSWGGIDKTATIANNGTWTVTYNTADIPADAASSAISANVNDAAGNPATEASKTVAIDTTAPTITINTIATDDIINAAEKATGVTVSGTATGANGQTISVYWGGIDKTATIANNGTWTVTYNTADIPADAASSAISANVSDTAANPATEVSKTVAIDTTAPTITINTIATDDIINTAEKACWCYC